MDFFKVSLIVFGLVLVGTELGSALKCHRCTSGEQYHGKECADLKSDKFVFDCDELTRETGLNYTMCRKFDQTVEGDHSIDRDCAAEGQNKCVLRTGTRDIKLEYCECYGELCNAATFTRVTFLSIVFSAALALVASS